MPKAKKSNPNPTGETVKTATPFETENLSLDALFSEFRAHNAKAENGTNKNPIYGVIVYKRENFTEDFWATIRRSFLVGSNSPAFNTLLPASADKAYFAIYGDCLDMSVNQGVRLDWLNWSIESVYRFGNTEEAKMFDSYVREGMKQDELEQQAILAAKQEAIAKTEAEKKAKKDVEEAKAKEEAAKAASRKAANEQPTPASLTEQIRANKELFAKLKSIPKGCDIPQVEVFRKFCDAHVMHPDAEGLENLVNDSIGSCIIWKIMKSPDLKARVDSIPKQFSRQFAEIIREYAANHTAFPSDNDINGIISEAASKASKTVVAATPKAETPKTPKDEPKKASAPKAESAKAKAKAQPKQSKSKAKASK